MVTLAAGSELEAFAVSGTIPTFTTNTLFFDNTMSRGAITLVAGTSSVLDLEFAATVSTWTHLFGYLDAGNGGFGDILEWSSGGTAFLRVFDNDDVGAFQYYNGSQWIDIGTGEISDAAKHTYDFKIVIHASAGEFTMYIDEVEVASFTGDTTQAGVSDCDTFTMKAQFFDTQYISQVIVDTDPTLNYQLYTKFIDGAGTLTDWNGVYTDVDETGQDNTDYVDTDVANNSTSYSVDDLTLPADYSIKNLVHSVAASIGTTGPQNLQLGTYSGGAEHLGSNLSGIDLSIRAYQLVVTTDPATGLSWDETTANAAQIVFKAKA